MSTHVLLAQTAILGLVSLAVLYPVVAHARTLLYTDAVVMLAASVLVFTAGALVEEGLGMVTAAEGIYLLSAVAFATAVWLFAREFIRIDDGSFTVDDVTQPGASPGFGDAVEADESAGVEHGFADAAESEEGADGE